MLKSPAIMSGDELRRLREACKLTQAELGALLGVSALTILRAEKTRPSRLVDAKMERALSQGVVRIPSKDKKK